MNLNLNFLTVQVHSVEVLHCILGLVLSCELNENIALRFVTDVITRDLNALDVTVALKVAA